jgi:histidyl-tRNA synthetase
MDNSSQNREVSGNIFSQKYNFTAVNPFSGNYDPSKVESETNTVTNPVKRLNGYDCTILNKTNFEGNPDNNSEELSLDYRIKDKEALVKDLDAKIKNADIYGTQNEALGLKAKRQRLLQELDSLRKQQLYGGRVLGETTSQNFHDSFKQKMPFIYKVQSFISRQILAKISKKVNSVVTLTDSLEQLSQISKSVDELVDMNVPYGEKGQSYEKLTEYLNQANLIHSKISKSLGKKV